MSVCALSSVISTAIRAPLAAVGEDRQPHKAGSPTGHRGEKITDYAQNDAVHRLLE
ncbi:unnamed protein product, partial [Rangifer tarandus platyrhynchus]